MITELVDIFGGAAGEAPPADEPRTLRHRAAVLSPEKKLFAALLDISRRLRTIRLVHSRAVGTACE